MELKRNRTGQWTVKLSGFPSESELSQLNALNLGVFKLDDSRGYKRLLHTVKCGTWGNTMECPINEKFII